MKEVADTNDKKTRNPIAKLLQCKIFQGRKLKNKKKYTRKEKTKKGRFSFYNPKN
jgi:hypothetical protein